MSSYHVVSFQLLCIHNLIEYIIYFVISDFLSSLPLISFLSFILVFFLNNFLLFDWPCNAKKQYFVIQK